MDMTSSSLDERGGGVREGAPLADSSTPTAEQHLIAAVTQFKKLETENQSEMEKLFSALSSPFKISNKACEAQRAQVLQCFQAMISSVRTTSSDNDSNARSDAHVSSSECGSSSSVAPDKSAIPALTHAEALRLPIHKCYEAAVNYQRCVDKSVLAEHAALSSRFRKESQ